MELKTWQGQKSRIQAIPSLFKPERPRIAIGFFAIFKSKIQIFYPKRLFSAAMLDGPKSRKKNGRGACMHACVDGFTNLKDNAVFVATTGVERIYYMCCGAFNMA